jgi:hypothetical protein
MNAMPRSVISTACLGLGAVPRSGPWFEFAPSQSVKPSCVGD